MASVPGAYEASYHLKCVDNNGKCRATLCSELIPAFS